MHDSDSLANLNSSEIQHCCTICCTILAFLRCAVVLHALGRCSNAICAIAKSEKLSTYSINFYFLGLAKYR